MSLPWQIERKQQMPNYLRTDEQHDVLVSLREVKHQLQRIDQDLNCWKWAVIALASAVNGGLTCNLTGTMQVGALTEKRAKLTIEALQSEPPKEIPDPRLAGPRDLLRRAQGVSKRFERAGRQLPLTESQTSSFKRLFDFRDMFVHFKPTGWSIEVSGMPSIFQDVMQIIEASVSDGWSFRHLEPELQDELTLLCNEIAQELEQLGRPQS